MANDGQIALPKLGGGLVDAGLAAWMKQQQGLTVLGATVSPGVTAGSPVASLACSDSASATVMLNARLPGANGAKTRAQIIRSTTDASLFDLDAWFPDSAASGNMAPTFTADAANDQITVTSPDVKLALGNGAGPFIAEVTPAASALPTGLTAGQPLWLVSRAGSPTVFGLASTKANAIGSPVVSINMTTSGTGTLNLRPMKAEHFGGLSMIKAHRRYAPQLVNVGGEGGVRPSEYVRLVDQNSATPDNRPVNMIPTALVGGGGSEFPVTGLKRRDEIVGAVDITNFAVWNGDQIVAVDKDTVALKGGSNITASDKVVVIARLR